MTLLEKKEIIHMVLKANSMLMPLVNPDLIIKTIPVYKDNFPLLKNPN